MAETTSAPWRPVPVALTTEPSLSPIQRALLASHLAHPGLPVQNMARLSHLDGPIDPDLLARAFAQVVASHDVLRTRIVIEAGAVDHIDLADADVLPSSEVVAVERAEVEAWAHRRAARPLDLAVCAWDSAIATHADGTASWFLNVHHALTDATSSSLIFEATAAIYQRLAGQDDPAAEPGPEPSSYYRWARELARTVEDPPAATRRALAHWGARPPAPRLGRLYRAPDGIEPTAHRLPVDLGPLADRAQERLDGDLAMLNEPLGWTNLLVTATALWCHRLTGSHRFAIGLPVHNRSSAASRGVVGPLMEIFPVDIEVRAGDTARDLHRRTGRAIMETLGRAVPGTAPPPDHDVVVNVITRAEQSRFGPVPATTISVDPGAIDGSHLARLQMTAYSGRDRSTGRGWQLSLDLHDGAADADHRSRAAGHLEAALASLVDHPDEPLASWGLCGPEELALLERWGHEPGFADSTPPVVDSLRAALADRTDPSLVDGDRVLSGAELWAWVESTAEWLRHRGVGPGTRVGVDLPRSAEAVVTILASLVADASFVPLDPAQPAARRRQLASRARCALVIDQVETVRTLATTGSATTGSSAGTGSGSATGEAYLLFTSGSTGQPKGVPIGERGLAQYLRFAAERYTGAGRPPPVAALFSPLTFDLTITSLFLPLLTGGRLIVVGQDGPQGLATVAGRTEINWLKATPSHLEILVRLLDQDHALATLVVGGEAFSTSLASRLLAHRPDLEIHNEYGPTEAVVGCMDYRVEPGLLASQADVPIGSPAPGVTLAIVDDHGQRVPIGASGELWISHPGLTTGYLDGAADDGPFVEAEGRRWYRSGDLVRLQDHDRLVYLGRRDEQVKVGGIRLEPMEVEQALAAHPAIAQAAVRLWSPATSPPAFHCVRCGLPDNVPGVAFDQDGVCETCHAYERVAPLATSWFRRPEDLAEVRSRAQARRTGPYDCLHLLSGGKDSTYALYQLVELGFRPYALTLDNGFISEQAKDNVARSVADLGVDHEFVTLEAMNAIFRDSLARHSNVCHGCYKAIYTVATNRAEQLGIPLIVTGLSRGQLFETRLIPQQFSADRFDPDAIDRAVLEARKIYHRLDDGPNRLLDTDVFTDDGVFERVEYLDIYRYLDVELADMLAFLDQRAPWVRPRDTGRSTNCLINAAGIHAHLTEQGYHNYAVPYAWDVRLGHKTRDEAIDELDDDLDLGEVNAMLDEVGYQPRARQILTAWLVPNRPAATDGDQAAAGPELPSPAGLRTYLGQSLPTHAIPAAFVTVDALPLSTNGKLDTDALPRPERVNRPGPSLAVSPTSPTEEAIIEVWEQILGTEPIGIDDEFFALGGDSLGALEMVVALGERLGLVVPEDLAFTNPTPRALAEAIDAIDTTPPARADGRSPTDAGSGSGSGPDPSRHRSGPEIPPERSPGELAVLHDQAKRPAQVMYNVARVYRIDGPVDSDAFARALRAEVDGHQPLTWTHGNPRRRLAPEQAVAIEVGRTEMTPEGFETLADDLNRRPVDLENGPLLRAAVQPLSDQTTAVVLSIHHASGDAASFDRLWRRLDQRLRGREPQEPPVDYAGFAAWQAERAATPDPLSPDRRRGDSDRAHWLAEGRRGPVAELAITPPWSPEDDGFASVRASVPVSSLRADGQASPAALALAALATVLARHSDPGPPDDEPPANEPEQLETEVEIGLITSTRDHPAADDLFGYFLNTLPVRLAIPAAGSTAGDRRHLLDGARAAIGGALAHRTYPRAQLAADRRAADLPIPELPVLLAWDELDQVELAGAPVEQRVLWNGTAVAPLTFFAEARGDRLDLSVEWQGDRVGAEVATTLLTLWDRVLAHLVSPSGQADPIEAVLTELDRSSMLDGPPAIADPGVLDQIERHLQNDPDPLGDPGDGEVREPMAVRCGHRQLEWAELDRRSRLVADRLTELGVGPGDRVAVLVPRSVELVVAMLGVLRAGASYVPIDGSAPAERARQILDASGAGAILHGPGLLPPATSLERSLAIDAAGIDGRPWTDEPTPARAPSDPPELDREAYLIFTSGSTGTPRGVPVTHRHLTASTGAREGVYPTRPRRFLVPSSPAFDSSIVGLFWTLAVGGTVVLPTDDEVHDLDALLTLLGTVDHTLLVPSLYRGLLDRAASRPGPEGGGRSWPDRVIVAGEACPTSLVEAHHQAFPQSALTNEYGPTEATVWATAHHCWPGDDPVPIGPPIPGAKVAVVDRAGLVVPRGVEGELVIAGVGVVDGYLDDEPATARAFGTLGADGPACFRTGDRAVISDGQLHFLGRDDDRLNVGGVRVEPEEIERVLQADPGVTTAAVVAVDLRGRDELLAALAPDEVAEALRRAADHADPAAALVDELRRHGRPDERLVAHIEGPADLDVGRLRELASGRLPAPLRPSRYVIHDRLPRTPNGKLDRARVQRLPVPTGPTSGPTVGPDRGHLGADSHDPALAARLGQLFARSLRLDTLAADQSFFDHGGHSLLAMELVLAIEAELGRPVPVAELYRHPTPAELAARLAGPVAAAGQDRPAPEGADQRDRSFLVPIQPDGTRPPIFAIHVLGVDCAFFRPLAARLGPDQPLYGLGQPTVDLDTSGPTEVSRVASSYAEEIARVAPSGPIALAAISLGGVVAYELAQQLIARGRDVELLVLFDTLGPGLESPATPGQWVKAQLTRAVGDPRRYASDQWWRQRDRAVRTVERAGLAIRRRTGGAIDTRLELRRFIEDNVQSQLGYRYEPHPGRMLVLKAGDDPLASAQLEASMGWAPVVRGGLEVALAPGGHLSMMEEPNIGPVAELVADALDHGPAAAAAAIGDVEPVLVRALRAGRLTEAVDRLQTMVEAGSEAADHLAQIEATRLGLARAADALAAEVVAVLGRSGSTATALPSPARLDAVLATVEVTDRVDDALQAASAALVANGYRAIGDRSRQLDHLDHLAPDGAARVRLQTSAPALDADPTAGAGAGPGDLGILLGTPTALVEPLFDLAGLERGQRLIDLGCGDGRVLIEAARRRDCPGVGYELDPELVELARQRVDRAGVGHLVQIVEGDARSADLAEADVVFAFLPPEAIGELLPSILAGLGPGARFLCHEQLEIPATPPPDESRLLVAGGQAGTDGGLTVSHRWSSPADRAGRPARLGRFRLDR